MICVSGVKDMNAMAIFKALAMAMTIYAHGDVDEPVSQLTIISFSSFLTLLRTGHPPCFGLCMGQL